MIDKTLVLKYGILIFIIEYILWSFILGNINLLNVDMVVRGLIVFVLLATYGIYAIIVYDNKSFNKETIEEKEIRMKKYVGELETELRYYNEAQELIKKINLLKK